MNQTIDVDAPAGRAVIAGRLVQITALAGGALRVGGPDGPTVRPISFGARWRATTAAEPREVVAAVTRAALVDRGRADDGSGDGWSMDGMSMDGGVPRQSAGLPAEVCALALWLAGAGNGGPPFWQTAIRVAAATGWAAEQIDAAEAITIDRLAHELNLAFELNTAPPDDGWHRIVFGGEAPADEAGRRTAGPTSSETGDGTGGRPNDGTGSGTGGGPNDGTGCGTSYGTGSGLGDARPGADLAEALAALVGDLITRSVPSSPNAETREQGAARLADAGLPDTRPDTGRFDTGWPDTGWPAAGLADLTVRPEGAPWPDNAGADGSAGSGRSDGSAGLADFDERAGFGWMTVVGRTTNLDRTTAGRTPAGRSAARPAARTPAFPVAGEPGSAPTRWPAAGPGKDEDQPPDPDRAGFGAPLDQASRWTDDLFDAWDQSATTTLPRPTDPPTTAITTAAMTTAKTATATATTAATDVASGRRLQTGWFDRTSARPASGTTALDTSPPLAPSQPAPLTSAAPTPITQTVVEFDVSALADALAAALVDEADLRGLLP